MVATWQVYTLGAFWYFFSVNSLAFAPDSKRIVIGSDDTLVTMWNIETGAQVRCFFVIPP